MKTVDELAESNWKKYIEDKACCVEHLSKESFKAGYAARDEEVKELKNTSELYHELFHEWNEDCDTDCSSWGHTETCKKINIGEAKKTMRLKIAMLEKCLEIAVNHVEQLMSDNRGIFYEAAKCAIAKINSIREGANKDDV